MILPLMILPVLLRSTLCFIVGVPWIVKLKDHFAFVCKTGFVGDFLYKMFIRTEFLLIEAQLLDVLFLGADFSL